MQGTKLGKFILLSHPCSCPLDARNDADSDNFCVPDDVCELDDDNDADRLAMLDCMCD